MDNKRLINSLQKIVNDLKAGKPAKLRIYDVRSKKFLGEIVQVVSKPNRKRKIK